MVGVVLGVSCLASTGGLMGDRGLAAWRHSCCGPFWSSVCPLVGAGAVVSLVASLAAAAVVGVCVGGGGGGSGGVCAVSRGWSSSWASMGGLFCFYLVKYFYVIENLLWTL